uniref:Putative ixodes 10 kDa peptide protein n=1 Tax=Ixodes ricinus TaxID=34613 RepID=A0A0K8RDA3_IXORI
MQLVVFAVVLILPSFLSGESFISITQINNECEGLLLEGGHSECDKQGSEFVGFDQDTCTVKCQNGRGTMFKNGVCSSGKVDCNSEAVKQKLRKWAYNM